MQELNSSEIEMVSGGIMMKDVERAIRYFESEARAFFGGSFSQGDGRTVTAGIRG